MFVNNLISNNTSSKNIQFKALKLETKTCSQANALIKDYAKKLPEEKINNIINTEDSLGEFLIYTTPDGEKQIQVRLIDETVWLSQKLMAELFQKDEEVFQKVFDELANSP